MDLNDSFFWWLMNENLSDSKSYSACNFRKLKLLSKKVQIFALEISSYLPIGYFYSNEEYNKILLFRGIKAHFVLYQCGVGHSVRHIETWSVNALNCVCNRRQTTLWLRHYVHRSCNEPFSSLLWPLANVRTGMRTEYSIFISRQNWTSSVARFVASNLSFHWRIMGNARRRRRTFTTTCPQSINIY